jgi:NADH:ubiquinone oxidoreductase subunit 6 (subunit J)
MLINLKVILLKQTLNHFLPLFLIFLIVNLFTIVFLNNTTGFTILENHTLYLETTHDNKDLIYPTNALTDESSAASLGSLLFNNFYAELLTSGFILLLAMVGSITLALKQNIRQKKQSILYNALK